MATCARCGRESPDEFGFCPGCGAPLGGAPREVRKVVTVLFCDLTGSTAIGERTDPEALRALMGRYYETAREVLERHGGTVEKFVGDAVMAVFGIPVSSEDDALRAVRAAAELHEVVHRLGLEARIGVNTGEVVAGEGDTLVTGDAVNVAARLEQAAGAGEILLGGDTHRLVRDAVDAESVELSLKGKSEVVTALRLRSLDPTAAGRARDLDRPIVGRARERARLRADFDDVVAGRTCRLFTLIGPAGIGKSRLVADFVEHLDGAQVARGRALSYGEGITYWPLVEILIQLGVEPSEAIRSSPAETQLATRALLERRAAERPVVLVIDDLQWAEEPMLDLVEHVVDWSRGAPIFVLCVARPELLDVRPGWAGGKLNATSVLLEPLAEEEAQELTEDLLEGIDLDAGTRQRILSTAEGNPLFLEEMAALAREARGAVEVPPTIRALLQARLDTLDDGERTVIQRGAVEGQIFHRGSVTALAPATPVVDVPQQLFSLVRKELVRPDEALIAGDDAFRFRHLLIRDAAYEGLPKAVRAELHERFADWLERTAALVEQDEIVGYHLEQAVRYRRELDPEDPAATALAQRAAERLGAAGVAAFEREDLHGARNLLGRAVGLAPPGPLRRRLIAPLVDARLEVNDTTGVGELIDELEGGDALDRATAAPLRAMADPVMGRHRAFPELAALIDEAQPVLEDAGDLLGAARCERARAMVAWAACRAGEVHRASLRCLNLLRRAGSTAFRSELISQIPRSAAFDGAPVSEIRALVDELEAGLENEPLLEAALRATRARLDYQAGVLEAADARAAVLEHAELLRQTGFGLEALFAATFVGAIEEAGGDPEAAERAHRESVERHEALGDRLFIGSALADWAVSLCLLGDEQRALDVVRRGRAVSRPDDVADQIALDAAEAFARGVAGDEEAARALMRRARTALDGIDMAVLVHRVRHTEAHLYAALGDVAGARESLEWLLREAERIGFARWADHYRRDLSALGPAGRD